MNSGEIMKGVFGEDGLELHPKEPGYVQLGAVRPIFGFIAAPVLAVFGTLLGKNIAFSDPEFGVEDLAGWSITLMVCAFALTVLYESHKGKKLNREE